MQSHKPVNVSSSQPTSPSNDFQTQLAARKLEQREQYISHLNKQLETLRKKHARILNAINDLPENWQTEGKKFELTQELSLIDAEIATLESQLGIRSLKSKEKMSADELEQEGLTPPSITKKDKGKEKLVDEASEDEEADEALLIEIEELEANVAFLAELDPLSFNGADDSEKSKSERPVSFTKDDDCEIPVEVWKNIDTYLPLSLRIKLTAYHILPLFDDFFKKACEALFNSTYFLQLQKFNQLKAGTNDPEISKDNFWYYTFLAQFNPLPNEVKQMLCCVFDNNLEGVKTLLSDFTLFLENCFQQKKFDAAFFIVFRYAQFSTRKEILKLFKENFSQRAISQTFSTQKAIPEPVWLTLCALSIIDFPLQLSWGVLSSVPHHYACIGDLPIFYKLYDGNYLEQHWIKNLDEHRGIDNLIISHNKEKILHLIKKFTEPNTVLRLAALAASLKSAEMVAFILAQQLPLHVNSIGMVAQDTIVLTQQVVNLLNEGYIGKHTRILRDNKLMTLGEDAYFSQLIVESQQSLSPAMLRTNAKPEDCICALAYEWLRFIQHDYMHAQQSVLANAKKLTGLKIFSGTKLPTIIQNLRAVVRCKEFQNIDWKTNTDAHLAYSLLARLKYAAAGFKGKNPTKSIDSIQNVLKALEFDPDNTLAQPELHLCSLLIFVLSRRDISVEAKVKYKKGCHSLLQPFLEQIQAETDMKMEIAHGNTKQLEQRK